MDCVLFIPTLRLTQKLSFFTQIPVPAASMWTKKELVEFKDSIRSEGGDSIIKVSYVIHFVAAR